MNTSFTGWVIMDRKLPARHLWNILERAHTELKATIKDHGDIIQE